MRIILENHWKSFWHNRTTPQYSKNYLQLFGLTVGVTFLTIGFVLGGYGLYRKIVHALDESSRIMPADVAFNRGAVSGLAGYSDGGGAVAVLSGEVRIATVSAWLSGEFRAKKTLTLSSLSSQELSPPATVQVTVNTKELSDAGKIQADCDDLRVAYIATGSGSIRQELSRTYTIVSGATDCSDSTATIVTFPLQETLWAGASDANYELYYDGSAVSAPVIGGSAGFNLNRQDGSTASATLACPFNGSTACADGTTPVTVNGSPRYTGGRAALSFDGSNDYVSPNYAASLDRVTIEMWVYIKSNPSGFSISGRARHCNNMDSTVINNGFSKGWDALNFYVRNLNGSVNTCTGENTSVPMPSLNTWHHIAGVYDGSQVRVYVDGVNQWTGGSAIGAVTMSEDELVGAGGWDGPLNGYIDEYRVSDSVRYTSDFTPSASPFVTDGHTMLLYHFDENGKDPRAADIATDFSGNGHNAAITGAKYVSGLAGVDASASDRGSLPSQPALSHQGFFSEEGTTNLVTNPSFENGSALLNWSLPYGDFNTSSASYSTAMAKRNSAGPFAAGIMVQGDWDGVNQYDVLTINNGTNIAGGFRSFYDANQGSVVAWITPEWNGNDNKKHIFYANAWNVNVLYKEADNRLYWDMGWGDEVSVDVSDWTAGTTYFVVARWSRNNTIDNVNHLSLSVNDVHAFGMTSLSGARTVADGWVGNSSPDNNWNNPANALIEGLTVYRRPLYDGSFGIDAGNGDEINYLYNAGTGRDPSVITGSWDVVFALPTNARTGSLASGTGNAWTHPYSTSLIYTSTTNTGGLMMGADYATDGWTGEGTPASVAALATGEKIYGGGYKVTSDAANEGITHSFASVSGNSYVIRVLGDSDGTCSPRIAVTRANDTQVTSMDGNTTSTKNHPDVYIMTFQAPATENMKLKLINAAASGTCHWHYAEILPNTVSNPSFETGSGDPWIPDSWTADGLGGTLVAGESSQSTSVKHSGAASFYLAPSGDSYQSDTIRNAMADPTPGAFYAMGGSFMKSGPQYQDSTMVFYPNPYRSDYSAQYVYGEDCDYCQSVGVGTPYNSVNYTTWLNSYQVIRGIDGPGYEMLLGLTGYYGTGYADDLYYFPLTPVGLTVTPANQLNSMESGGMRIDGADTMSMPVSGLTSDSGIVKFQFTPRHDFAQAASFGSATPVVALFYGDNNNYLTLYRADGTGLRAMAMFNGWMVTANYDSPEFSTGTTYNVEMSYVNGGNLVLKLNGVQVASAPIGARSMGVPPHTVYFGYDGTGGNQYDGVFGSFSSLTASANSSVPYHKFGGNSVSLVAHDSADQYTTSVSLPANGIYTLSAYVYNGTSGSDGGAVDTTVATLASSSAALSTVYTDMGGGWWRLTSTTGTAIPAGTYNFGVEVKSSHSVYVDGVQVEAKSYATTYTDGSLGNGYSWSGTTHNSASARAATSLQYPLSGNVSLSGGSVSFWMKPTAAFFNHSGTNNSTIKLIDLGSSYFGSDGGFSLVHYNADIDLNSEGFGGTGRVYRTLAANQDTWIHIVATWNGTQGSLYANTDRVTGSFVPHNFATNVIGIGDGYEIISDVRFYDKALSPDEVGSLYYAGLVAHASGTESVARYAESATYTSPIIDLSANGGWGETPITFADAANNGAVLYYTRTSADNSVWSDWAAVTGDRIASNPRRYFQWRADMASAAGGADSPVITGMTLHYVEDSNPPVNPQSAALGFSNAATVSADLVSGGWYNHAAPKFTWEAGSDAAVDGQSASGVGSYLVLLTTDSTATPSANVADNCYLEAGSGSRQFIAGSTPSTCSLTDGVYYLRLQTKDNSGNLSDPVTLFTYRYDATIPEAPASVAATNVGYQATNSFTFYWPAAADNGPSGVKGYEYKTGTTSGALANWQFTANTLATDIPAYQEGQNFFYVRTVDNGGNYSGFASNNISVTSFYFNSTAPTAPLNMAISPPTSAGAPSSANVFTVTWDKPATFSGEIAKYYYCVNCTPSADTMTETTPAETVNRKIENAALATQQGKNTLYLVAEDNNVNTQTGHGNRNFEAYVQVDFYASTTAPGSPRSLSVSDTSDRDSDMWRLTLAWKPPADGGTPADYEVFRSTDDVSFASMGKTTSTAYTDAGLTQSAVYYYKVKAIDNAGSSSLFSNTVSKAPEGKYSAPPTAGGAPAVTAGSTTATITWSTSRTAFGTVEYGKSTGYGSAGSETASTKAHSVKLTGLAPGTDYHYRVLSMDDSSMVGYARTDAYSADYSFTTLKSPSIADVKVSDVSLTSAIVTWKMSAMTTTKVEYGETTNYDKNIENTVVASESSHMVKLSSLKHSTAYHFRVRGTDSDQNELVSDDYSFSTLMFPKVTAVVFNTDETESGTSVVLAWSTNTHTGGEVEYQAVEVVPGESKPLSKEALQRLSSAELAKLQVVPKGGKKTVYSGGMDTKHLVRIPDLTDGSLYVFTVRGRDSYGNEAISDPIRYMTGIDTRPPAFQNVIVETPITGVGADAKAQIIISWDTDEASYGQVLWGPGTGAEYPQATEKDQYLTTKHVMVIRDLTPTTSYHLRIVSSDRSGNKAESSDTVVVTPSAQTAAFDVIIKNLEDVFGFLKL